MAVETGNNFLNPTFQVWLRDMQEKGHLPQKITRLIIDVGMDAPIKMYVAAYGDAEMFDGDLMDIVCRGDVVTLAKKEDT